MRNPSRMEFFGKRQLAIYRGARLRPVAPKIFGLWAASSSLTRRRSATSRRNREISSWSSTIPSSPLRVRLGSSASLRHRCKVMTLTPSVRAISLCSLPRQIICPRQLRRDFHPRVPFPPGHSSLPAAVTSIGYSATPSIAVFWTNRRGVN